MPRKAKSASADTHSDAVEAAIETTQGGAEFGASDNPADNLPPGGINDKIRALIRQSKEQGYLTFDDINEALPDSVENQEEIDNVLSILQNLEIEILEPEQVEEFKQRQTKEEEDETRSSQNDILDDPVRMYLKQMGQVPLLTREQEVEISKRIETAELTAQEVLFEVAIVGKYIAGLGQKLIDRTERFDRIVIDKKIESRDAYFKNLPKYVELTAKNEESVAESWDEYQKAKNDADRKKILAKHSKREATLRSNFSKYFFKLKVYEEWLEQLQPVRAAVRALVEAIVGQSTDEAAPDRVRAAVLMMAVTAFGDAVIGPHVRAMLDQPDDAMRDLIARILPLFLIPTGIPPAAP